MNQIKRKNSKLKLQNNNATRMSVSAFGVLCGLTGIVAGYFETLQGNVATSGFIISTIGPTYSMLVDLHTISGGRLIFIMTRQGVSNLDKSELECMN